MGYRSLFIPVEMLRELAEDVSRMTGQSVPVSALCDRVGNRPIRGAYGANLEDKLSRFIGPKEARVMVRELAERYLYERYGIVG